MTDFSKLVGQDIRDSLQSVNVTAQVAAIQERLQAKKAAAEQRLSGGQGFSQSQRFPTAAVSSIAAPIGTPGQEKSGKGITLQ